MSGDHPDEVEIDEISKEANEAENKRNEEERKIELERFKSKLLMMI